ncbi:translation initiation factor IF-2-like [Orcinus orca]|uniref:translation initiation factor IF-2-like n=1 Tax=Orcinus orca TaxID=9733 RepID=UPI00211199C6|nr:translation initiation factor IF-2-like [Orcinus orca]
MRPPRRLRPRPSAPAALPPLPPILCLLSRSWHLSQRARFPAHPFAAGSGRGRGYGGPGEEGTGKQGAYGPAARGDRPGAAAVTRSRAPLFRPGAAPPRRPPPNPPSAAHPPPGAGARGRGGRREQRIRRPGPAPGPAAPRARPRGHAAPGAPRPRGPGRLPPRGRGHRAAGTHQPSASRPAARTPRPRPAPAALAPRRLPERARRLRSEAPAAMIAGSGARARTLGPGLGTRGEPTVPGLNAAPCEPRSAARSPGSSQRETTSCSPGPGRRSCGEKF